MHFWLTPHFKPTALCSFNFWLSNKYSFQNGTITKKSHCTIVFWLTQPAWKNFGSTLHEGISTCSGLLKVFFFLLRCSPPPTLALHFNLNSMSAWTSCFASSFSEFLRRDSREVFMYCRRLLVQLIFWTLPRFLTESNCFMYSGTVCAIHFLNFCTEIAERP